MDINKLDIKNHECFYDILYSNILDLGQENIILLSLLNSIIFPNNENELIKARGFTSFYDLFIVQNTYEYHYEINAKDKQGKKIIVELHFSYLNEADEIRPEIKQAFKDKVINEETRDADYPIYFIIIGNFGIIGDKDYIKRIKYPSPYKPNQIELIFISLSKFNKQIDNLHSTQDNWMWIFQNGLQQIKNEYQDKGLKALYNLFDAKEFSDDYIKKYNQYYRIEELERNWLEANKNNPEKIANYIKHENANLNMLLFEKQIGIYPYKEKEEFKFNVSAIHEKRTSITFNLFKKWTKLAQEEYPNYDFTIKNEQKLISDFEDSMIFFQMILLTKYLMIILIFLDLRIQKSDRMRIIVNP